MKAKLQNIFLCFSFCFDLFLSGCSDASIQKKIENTENQTGSQQSDLEENTSNSINNKNEQPSIEESNENITSVLPENLIRIYVSSSGSDDNDGLSSEQPVHNIERAIELSSDYIHNQNVAIKLLDDAYYVSKPICINNNNTSVTGETSLYFQGNGNTVINGGIELQNSWAPVEGRNNVWVTDLSDTEVNNINGFYVNGELYKEASTELSLIPDGIQLNRNQNNEFESIAFKLKKQPELMSLIQNQDEMSRVRLTYRWEWKNNILNVKSLTEENDDVLVEIDDSISSSFNRKNSMAADFIPNYNQNHIKIWLSNNLELLTKPNEYYFDPSNKKLYLFSEADPSSSEITIPQSNGLLRIEGTDSSLVNHVGFLDLSFAYGTDLENFELPFISSQADYGYLIYPDHYEYKLRPSQIAINFASDILFVNCTFKNNDTTMISMDQYTYNTQIERCSFESIGGGAIRIGSLETEDAASKDRRPNKQIENEPVYSVNLDPSYGDNHIPQNIKIVNNKIYETGTLFPASPAVNIMYGHKIGIIHNDIENTPYSGISVGWGWNNSTNKYVTKNSGKIKISNNRLTNTVNQLNDGAPIYALGVFGEGLEISDNYINTNMSENGYHGGIYLDEGSENIYVNRNVIIGCQNWIDMRISPRPDQVGSQYIFNGIDTSTLINITIENNFFDSSNEPSSVIDVSRIAAQNIEEANVIYKDNQMVPDWENNAEVMEIVNNSGVEE